MSDETILPVLFRTEYRKIISVLGNRFGFSHVGTAEDIASETFLTAAQTWGVSGTPANPTAWLYQVAKNKAVNYLVRQKIFHDKVAPNLMGKLPDLPEIDLSPQNIADSQLQMMFAICHPSISEEAQIALSLRILCGFGIEEIADAFLTNRETISKRLQRAKEKLREQSIQIALPDDAHLIPRLAAVLKTLYLLFNEGYYSGREDTPVRRELCFEAIRLCTMLIENQRTCTPDANALMALMCFHASRLDARQDECGILIRYDDQDDTRWNSDLISKGGFFLRAAATGDRVSLYHLAAGIASWNSQRINTPEKWNSMLRLYDELLAIDDSPFVAMNRLYVLAMALGKKEAIRQARELNLPETRFYFALLGELYTGVDNPVAAECYKKALSLITSETGRNALLARLRTAGIFLNV